MPNSQLDIGPWASGIGHLICALMIAGALVCVACGKKGPPLAPIAHIPAAVDKLAATRLGDDMYVSLTVPAKNIDGSIPADIARIDVYGVTSIVPPSPNQILVAGTKVASVPVAKPPLKGEEPKPTNDPVQGSIVSIHDALTAADLLPKTLPTAPTRLPAPVAPPLSPQAEPEEAPLPQRYYLAFPFSERGRPGPPGTRASVPLDPLPPAPGDLRIMYTADTLTLRWDPVERPAPDAPPSMAISYNVYRRESPDPLDFPEPPRPSWAVGAPKAANLAPLAMPVYTEPTDFDHEICFVVRTVRGGGPTAVESVPSGPMPACVMPVDTFPPAPPKSLSAVPAEGAISLIWEPNSEPDLDGYLVLRGEAGSATLQPLTATPIAETQFTDRTVKSGVRYVYAVVAVDNRLPVPNVSAESNRVEETAR